MSLQRPSVQRCGLLPQPIRQAGNQISHMEHQSAPVGFGHLFIRNTQVVPVFRGARLAPLCPNLFHEHDKGALQLQWIIYWWSAYTWNLYSIHVQSHSWQARGGRFADLEKQDNRFQESAKHLQKLNLG